jgi:A/G-specific adenine glycosylase
MPSPSSKPKTPSKAFRPLGLPAPASELARALLSWYRRNGRRNLPWRGGRDPYAIWVSEVMLQQTRVPVVIPYYARFLAKFPDLAALASAPQSQVLSLWSGLGYYARARSLHAAAKEIRTPSAFPRTFSELRALPGFGPYTAAAVASMAFGQPEPAIDGNAVRVYTRLLALREPRPAAEHRLREAVRPLLTVGPPSLINQAVMDLAQLICTPRRPACSDCPWARNCRGRRLGLAESLPQKSTRPMRRKLDIVAAVIDRGARRLFARRRDDGLFGGLWELPGGEYGVSRGRPAEALGSLLRDHLGVDAAVGAELGSVTRTLTHRDLHVTAYRAAPVGRLALRPAGLYTEARFFGREEIENLGVSTATRKLLQVLK